MPSTDFVTPTCCAAVQENHTIFLRHDYKDVISGQSDAIKPEWRVMAWTTVDGWAGWNSIMASFCPHCATPVPSIRRCQRQKPVCRIIDGGYYCDTCHERLMSCTCLPVEFNWEPEENHVNPS